MAMLTLGLYPKKPGELQVASQTSGAGMLTTCTVWCTVGGTRVVVLAGHGAYPSGCPWYGSGLPPDGVQTREFGKRRPCTGTVVILTSLYRQSGGLSQTVVDYPRQWWIIPDSGLFSSF